MCDPHPFVFPMTVLTVQNHKLHIGHILTTIKSVPEEDRIKTEVQSQAPQKDIIKNSALPF